MEKPVPSTLSSLIHPLSHLLVGTLFSPAPDVLMIRLGNYVFYSFARTEIAAATLMRLAACKSCRAVQNKRELIWLESDDLMIT